METKIEKLLNNFDKLQFQSDLIGWFMKEQRMLPWRKNKDPYKIWVSEVMLQQTRVETVIPYFNNFIEQFPTVEALATAEEEKVLKAWEGLGYYSRARNLQSAVKEVVAEYGGQVPNNPKTLSKLKGVGPYTQGAILSIAYDIPEPAVDGNVMRVLARILFIEDDISKVKTRKLFENVVRELISSKQPSEFNQGLMELGALICTPKSPSCLLCPVQEHCRAFHEGLQDELPFKTTKKAPKEVLMTALVLKNKAGQILVQKRPSEGLLANLWELPNQEMAQESIIGQVKQMKQFMKSEYRLDVEIGNPFMHLKHEFSHLIWKIAVYHAFTDGKLPNSNSLRFVSSEEIAELPFPVPYKKIISEILW
ncbi:MAG TPA: A/G-specific adenine glycosylase [Bacillus bacterium]|nr:A/G-specific adenine glycosylase [Bacillus sp. (in: firmicutes)]